MLFAGFWAGVSWSSSHVNAVLVLNPIKLHVVGFSEDTNQTRLRNNRRKPGYMVTLPTTREIPNPYNTGIIIPVWQIRKLRFVANWKGSSLSLGR